MKKVLSPRAESKRELYQVVVARSDVTAALRACDLLLENVRSLGDDLYEPLFHAVAVAYARPFTANRPFGPLPPAWARFTDPRLQAVHDNLIHARNKFVAHSDEEVRKVDIVPPGSQLPGLEAPTVGLGVQIRLVAFPIHRFREIKDLCMDLGRRLNHRVDELLNELYSGQKLPAAPFALRLDDGL